MVFLWAAAYYFMRMSQGFCYFEVVKTTACFFYWTDSWFTI